MANSDITEAVEIIYACQIGSSVPPVSDALDTIAASYNFLQRTGVDTIADFDAIIDLMDKMGERLLEQVLMPDIEEFFIQRFVAIFDFLRVSQHHVEFPVTIYYLWGKINVSWCDGMPHHARVLLEIEGPDALDKLDPTVEALAALADIREVSGLCAAK